MSTSKTALSFFLDSLSFLPNLQAKAMFWEYGIYEGEKMFALACDNTLFLKTAPETIHFFEDTETKAYPGSKNTAPVNPDWLENTEELKNIVNLTLAHMPISKKKTKK